MLQPTRGPAWPGWCIRPLYLSKRPDMNATSSTPLWIRRGVLTCDGWYEWMDGKWPQTGWKPCQPRSDERFRPMSYTRGDILRSRACNLSFPSQMVVFLSLEGKMWEVYNAMCRCSGLEFDFWDGPYWGTRLLGSVFILFQGAVLGWLRRGQAFAFPGVCNMKNEHWVGIFFPYSPWQTLLNIEF